MSFKLLWNLSARGLSSHLKQSSWATEWRHRLKKYRTCGIAAYSRKANNSQWLLRRLRTALDRYGRKAIVLSATGVYNATKDTNTSTPFNWSDCNIKDNVLDELTDEMSDMESLKLATVICGTCKKRLVIDKMQPGTVYCSCVNNKAVTDPNTGWQPFLEDKDIIIWKREQKGGGGLYAYKVYGRYNEVTAEDFLAMHIDTDYWQSWDTSALSVRTLDNKLDRIGGQCVIHWEMLWPRFFTNRDYVYVRRYAYVNDNVKYGAKNKSISNSDISNGFFNENLNKDNPNCVQKHNKLILITSRSCNHPEVPESANFYRVKKYWSNLVIKPFSAYDKPGIEFSLTYFDDPGANIPSSLQTWVAGHGMPDFLAKMRKAAAVYKKVINDKDSTHTTLIPHLETTAKTSLNVINLDNKNNEEISKKQNDNSTEEFLNLLYGKTSNTENSPKINNKSRDESVHQNIDIVEVKRHMEFNCKNSSDVNENRSNTIMENNTGEMTTIDNKNTDMTINSSKLNQSQENKNDITQMPNVSENQDKPASPQQSNNYSYWHLWPLYYFA